jgi:hypothetical protein
VKNHPQKSKNFVTVKQVPGWWCNNHLEKNGVGMTSLFYELETKMENQIPWFETTKQVHFISS